MIDKIEYIFFISYIIICIIAIITQIKIKSTENIIITTIDFKFFQNNFLYGYTFSILGELLSIGSFYQSLKLLELNNYQITKLFIISLCSTTLFGLFTEIVDIGSKRMKCILSGILFGLATITIFFHNYDILIIGRVLYGIASSLLHSGFDSYLIHEHNSQGFPDDWLMQTFSKLVHSIVIVTMLSGTIGQYVFSMFGPHGNLIFICILYSLIVLFIFYQWNSDIASKRFMLSNFFQSVGQSIRIIQSNTQTALLVLLSACVESTILLFSFYWAPWIISTFSTSYKAASINEITPTAITTNENNIESIVSTTFTSRYLVELNTTSSLDSFTSSNSSNLGFELALPCILIYSSLMTVTMIGHYFHTLSISSYGNDFIFQSVLSFSSLIFLLASISSSSSSFSSFSFFSPSFIYILSLCIQFCNGGYWPSVGYLRGKYLLTEIRGVVIALTRLISFFIVWIILITFYDQPSIVFLFCSLLNLLALGSLMYIFKLETKLQNTNYFENDEED